MKVLFFRFSFLLPFYIFSTLKIVRQKHFYVEFKLSNK